MLADTQFRQDQSTPQHGHHAALGPRPHAALPIRSQFVVAGNIRDSFLTPLERRTTLAPLLRCLWAHLAPLDYRFLLVYDPVDGLRPYPNEPAAVELATKLFDLKLADGVMPMSLENLVGVMRKVAGLREARCALVVDFASRIARQPDHLDANEHRFFVAAETHLADRASDRAEGRGRREPGGKARFNPVLWLVNRGAGPAVVARRSTPTRIARADARPARLRDAARSGAAPRQPVRRPRGGRRRRAREVRARLRADCTDGLPLVALADIAQLADRQGIGFRDVDDAVRCYKVGVAENPWKKDYLRERIAGALPLIEERVQGPARRR